MQIRKHREVQTFLFHANACKRPRKKRYLPPSTGKCWCGADTASDHFNAKLCAFHRDIAMRGGSRFRKHRSRNKQRFTFRMIKRLPIIAVRDLQSIPAEKWGSLEFFK